MDAINFALEAGRRLQRKQTGLIHFCHQSEDLTTHDTIPVLENALFALSLFRTRLSENVLEGKAIIQRLLAFEKAGQFPTYIHAYPHISDPYLSLRLVPIFFWIVTDFGHVIGSLKGDLEEIIEKIMTEPKPSSWAQFRFNAFEGKIGTLPQNIYEWGEGLISLQIAEKHGASIQEPIRKAFELWHPELSLYIGPAARRNQEGNLPELTLFDLFMCQWQKRFSARAANIAPVHLQGALIRPLGFEVEAAKMSTPYIHFNNEEECPLFIAWDQHTFVLAKQQHLVEGDAEKIMVFPKEDEIHFYFNHHPDHQILVNRQKSNTFRQNDTVEILSKGINLNLQFSAEDGTYMGHILRGNRPSQHHCKGENLFAAFDWQLTIRAINIGKLPVIFNVKTQKN
ncbi:MAG: hypothetical protein JSS30_07055 [Verrucomicrobia bacterium]|nr:hypothetical protein [Verrucomicrobiota bacterium]